MNPVIKSFNGGEISPLLMGRIDLESFPNSCIALENAICLVQGPATRRGGFRFVSEVKDSSKAVRVVPFEVGTDAAYVLEAGEEYFRFFQGLARLESAGVPVEVVTAFLEAELFDFHYAQSADLLYLFHESHAPAKLARLAASGLSWSVKTVNFKPPPLFEEDSDYSGGTITISLSAVTGSGVQVLSSADVFLAADKNRLLKYLDGRASITAVVGARQVTVEILDDFPDALAPQAASGNITTVGVDASFLETHGLVAGNWVRLTAGAQAGEKKRVVDVPDGTHATLEAAFSVDQAATAWAMDFEIAAGSWKMDGSPVADCTPSVATPVGSIATLTLGAQGWRSLDVTAGKYVKISSGIVKLTTYIGATQVSGQIVKVLSSTATVAGGAWSAEVPAWSASAGYPSTGCFYGPRLLQGPSRSQPTNVWGSQSGDYENHAGGTNESDALTFPLTGIRVNKVRWLAAAKELLGGTSAGEFTIRGDADASLTPTNPDPKSETTHGGSSVMPVRVGHLVLFVQARGRKVREIVHDYQVDAFVAPDLTRFAEHITTGGIVDMAYQQEPESILWCVRADGVLLGMTYNREDKVYGWHRHVTEGAFESVCVIPDPANHRDQLWAVVRREVGGATKRYIEVLDPDRKNADCFAVYSGSPATVITGLSHLEGLAVDVVADGFVVPGHTVSGGAITLSREASEVVVGLHYESTVTPVRPDYQDDRGNTTIGRSKQWQEVILRLLETGLSGVRVNGKTLPPRAGSDPLGSAPALFTGDIPTPNVGADTDGIVTIQQVHPLPFTLLAITGTLDVRD